MRIRKGGRRKDKQERNESTRERPYPFLSRNLVRKPLDKILPHSETK